MKLKKVLSLVLVGVMSAALLAGCGGATEEEGTAPAANASSEAADGEEGEEAADAADAAEADTFEGFDELQTIEMYGMTFYGDAGAEEVMEKVNEISEAEINVHVNYHALDTGAFMQQIPLMLSGGEAFDLVMVSPIPVSSFSVMTAQKELMPITEYVEEYAPDALALVGDYIPATTIDGEIYSLPISRQTNSNLYWYMRKDILEYLDLLDDFENAQTWDDFETICLAIKDAQDTLPEELRTNCVIPNSDQGGSVISNATFNAGPDELTGVINYDNLGDLNKLLYVDPETDTVMNLAKSDDYRKVIERVHKWYTEGIILKDAATSQDAADTMVANGIAAGCVTVCEYGIEAAKTAATGHEIVAKMLSQGSIMTNTANTWGWGVPTTSENPEAAVAFVNLMYKNAEIQNLFVYGLEGRDYELNEAGEAVKTADAVYNSSDWCFGDQFMAYPQAGTGSTFREDAKADTLSAGTTKYFGCVVDTGDIANEITACSTVIAKYQGALESGTTDPADLDKYIAELDSAGIDVILEHYQKTLDEFLGK